MAGIDPVSAAWDLVLDGSAADAVANWILSPFGRTTARRKAEIDGSYSRKFHSIESDYVINEVRKRLGDRSNTYISNTSTTIYNFSGSQNSPYVELPIPPERRLQPLSRTPDTSKTKDVKAPVVTVEKALKYKQWGELLHEPISNETIEIDKYNGEFIARQINSTKRESTINFIRWARDSEPVPFDDQALFFIDYPNFSTKRLEIEPIYGIKSLSLMYASWFVRSANAGLPIISQIPKEIKYKDKELLNGIVVDSRFPFQASKNGNLSKVIGVDNYPIIAPDSLLGDGKKETKLETIPETLVYILKNLDGVVGQFPLEIKIKDSDLIQGGDQSKTIKIPNLSEGIAELMGLAINGEGYNQALLNLGYKNIVQSSKNAISGAVAQDHLVAIGDYLGFEQKDIERKMDFLITPNKSDLTESLKNSTQTYKSIELTDKKDLNDYFVDLLQAAAIIKGSLFKKFNPNNLTKDIKDYLNNMKSEDLKNSDDDWRSFLNNVENGFPDKPTQLKEGPYNRNKSNRPRIKDHGDLGK